MNGQKGTNGGGGGSGWGQAAGVASQITEESFGAPKYNTAVLEEQGLTNGYSKFSKRKQGIDKAQKGIEDAGIASGNPYAMLIGAGMKVTRTLDNQFRGDDGMYKNKASLWSASFLDPAQGTKNLFSGELLGYGKLKAEVAAAKRFQANNKVFTDQRANEAAGAKLRTTMPAYQAPAYGRAGMKFSKFSKS